MVYFNSFMEKVIPNSLGIIVDGNRRWAKERGLPTLEGHRRGFEKLQDLTDWANEAGIKYVVAYVFSTENWHRAPEEVSYLMDLLRQQVRNVSEKFDNKNYRLKVIGVISKLAPDLQNLIQEAIEKTQNNTGLTVTLALSYGGRDEIVDAVNKILKDENKPQEITPEVFEKYLWSSEIPDLDMIVRTSGEHRLSNFMTWKSVYSELFFPEEKFPGMTKELFYKLLEEYSSRQRRFGK
jgi:undecaprenyl diphosphate synthase